MFVLVAASSLQSVPSAIMNSKPHRKLKNPLSPKLSSPLLISPRLGVESRERSHSEERLNGDGGSRRQTRPKLRRGKLREVGGDVEEV